IGHDVVAVRCEAARMDRQTPPTPEIGIGARHIMRVFVAAEIVKEKMIVLLGRGKNRDSAAHRAIAEQAGRCAAIDFDAAYVGRIDTVPIDPAAERIIQRDAVPENQRPAGARGAGSAKRNTLRSGICDNAGGAAEQAETGHLPQAIVQFIPRYGLELVLSKYGDRGGRLARESSIDSNRSLQRGDLSRSNGRGLLLRCVILG